MKSNLRKTSSLFLSSLVLALSLGLTSGARAQNAPSAVPVPASALSPDLTQFLSTFYADGGGGSTVKTRWVPSIAVTTPTYGATIKGDTTITFKAPGMTTVHALCWQQPTSANASQWGHDTDIAPDLKLGADGTATFVFHADQFPNGPINVRLFAKDAGTNQDYCELQLFNQGGVVWNQGIPKSDPVQAEDLKVVYSDDFDGPLSIAKDNSGKYWTHWGGGDGSVWPFTDFESPLNPFSQVKGQTKNYLRIRATKPAGTNGAAGTLTPIHPDGTGFMVKAPCYFECRFLAQNATGTWPAFWLTSHGDTKACDELDAIEAYGTNSQEGGIWTAYHCTSHFWNQPPPSWVTDHQKGPDGNPYDAHRMVPAMQVGGHNAWSTTFHTFGVLITPESTAYYLDNVEVLRHPTGPTSATMPFSFLVNLAIGGGGWNPNLTRYGNQSDMYVDWVRVYGKPENVQDGKKAQP